MVEFDVRYDIIVETEKNALHSFPIIQAWLPYSYMHIKIKGTSINLQPDVHCTA